VSLLLILATTEERNKGGRTPKKKERGKGEARPVAEPAGPGKEPRRP